MGTIWNGAAPSPFPGGVTALNSSAVRGTLATGTSSAALRGSITDAIKAYAATTAHGAQALARGALDEIPQEVLDEGISQLSAAWAEKKDMKQAMAEFFTGLPQLIATSGLLGAGGQHIAQSGGGQPQTGQPQQQQTQIPVNTTSNHLAASAPPSGQPSQTSSSGSSQPSQPTANNSQPPQTSPSPAPAKPSRPPLDVETSKKLIANVEARAKKRPLSPVEQADLDQAKSVVVAHAQKIIDNISKLRPEAQQHPKVRKDLAEAKKLVETHGKKPQPSSTKTATNDGNPSESPTSTQSSSGSLPPGTSATTNGDAPPTATHTGEPPESSSSDDEPSGTTATWSTGGADHTRSSSDSTYSDAPPDLPTAAKALDTAKALRNKGGRITLDEAHKLDQAEKTFASAIKANLEKKKGVTGALTEHETRALDQANATLARLTPRDRGPLPSIPDARRTIQDLSSKAAAGGPLNADEAHQMAHAQRAIAQQGIDNLHVITASGGTLTVAQQRAMAHDQAALDASPYGTTLPKGPPAGFDPDSEKYGQWHPPHGDKPVHPANDKFTPEALAISEDEIKTTKERLKSEGHAHDRHGPEVTEGQLGDRSVWGVDPITQTKEDGVHHNEDHGYSRHATQFTSDRAMVQALKAVETSTEFVDALKKAEEHNLAHPEAPEHQIKVRIPLQDALGTNYEKHVRGISRLGSAKKPTGQDVTDLKDGTVFALYRYDQQAKKYKLYTMYPDK